MSRAGNTETILIVDDEDTIRQTFREWLEHSTLGCRVLTAADDASAMLHANEEPIDLAILDWNLGAGTDGLSLLGDLQGFQPDIVAIMITGFANQATPLQAMRMGVRDYLDKNQELSRETFLAAVQRQMDVIRPAKQARRVNQGLAAFRSAVEQVLPLVQTASALHDPLPLPAAIRSLFAFLVQTTQANSGALIVREYDPERLPAEVLRAYDPAGQPLPGPLPSFACSLAGSVCSMQEAYAIEDVAAVARDGSIELMPFERGARNLLLAPVAVVPGHQVVLELLDKTIDGIPAAFTTQDRQVLRVAAELGGELLRQALSEKRTQSVLFDAVAAALHLGDAVRQTIEGSTTAPPLPPADVLDLLRDGLRDTSADAIDADSTCRLAEAIRVLALRYGEPAVRHCILLVENLRTLLDDVTGAGGEARS